MATYTLVQSISAQDNMHMVGDGAGNLYVVSLNTSWANDIRVTQYNIGTDTATDISGATFGGNKVAGSDGELPIAWFNNDLYVGVGDSVAQEFQVYRWDGGTSWTQVDNQSNGGAISTLSPHMDSDANRIFYTFFASGSGVRTERVSTDGSSWSNATLTKAEGSTVYNSIYQGELVVYCSAAGSADVDKCCWTALNPSSFASRVFTGTADSKSFWKGAGTSLYYSTDWGTNITSIPGTWYISTKASVYELSLDVGLISNNSNRDQVRTWNSGTLTWDLDGTPAATVFLKPRLVEYGGYLYVLGSTTGIYVRDNPIGPVTAVDFDVSPKYEARGMDVSADDLWLYVAVLESTNPVLLKLNSDLSVDPTRAFNPGSGDAIAVVAGRQTDEGVWISGRFDGTNKVELSDDYGATWTVKDPATWAGRAYPPLIGPDDDGRMIIATDQDDDLHETTDVGTTWEERNTSLPFDVGDMDHLDVSPDELVIASNTAAANRVNYSPNRGRSLEDISLGSQNFETVQIVVG